MKSRRKEVPPMELLDIPPGANVENAKPAKVCCKIGK
jgi:hypothetical protein